MATVGTLGTLGTLKSNDKVNIPTWKDRICTRKTQGCSTRTLDVDFIRDVPTHFVSVFEAG